MNNIPSLTFNPIELLRVMQISRECDRREGILLRQGKSLLLVPSAGHEALAVMAHHLEDDDYIFPYYRDRALILARGFSIRQMARDFLGRATSSSGGRNMPLHITARELNIFSVATPTGGQCLPAVGAAWGLKLDEAKASSSPLGRQAGSNVVLCTIGDAAVRQGDFYEAVCLAVQEKLPIVFLVEDNAYGISTPTEKMLPFNLGIFNEALIMPVNGRDVDELLLKGEEAIQKARQGEGATILWAKVDRLFSHTNADDQRVYRSEEELRTIEKRDPIKLFAAKLIEAGKLSDEGWKRLHK
jgi:2-oxoisovalerate dehydrogenase E1 component